MEDRMTRNEFLQEDGHGLAAAHLNDAEALTVAFEQFYARYVRDAPPELDDIRNGLADLLHEHRGTVRRMRDEQPGERPYRSSEAL